MHFLRLIILASFIGVFIPSLHAQKKVDPTEEDIKIAKEIKEKYEDDRIASLLSSNTYTFEYDEKKDRVLVIDNEREDLIGLVPNTNYTPYIFYDEMSSLKDVSVKYPNGKKVDIDIVDEYYNIDEYFYSDARVNKYKIYFQATGTRYNLEHEKTIHDIKYYTTSYFHTVYSIKERVIKYVVPDWLDIELKEMNFEGYDVEKTVETNAKDKTTTFTYIVHDTETISRERGAPGNSHTYPHILLLSKSYTIDGEKKKLFSSAKDLYSWYKSLVKGMDNNPEFIKEKTLELIKNKTSDVDKIKSIFYWVQDNIRYIAFEDGIAGFQPDECQNVYENKYGDCKGMANLTKEMLIIAGYDARLTWIGTKRIAYDYSLPTMAVDNHMICTVILDGKQYFLDPTEKFSSFNEYAGRIEGKQVMIEDGEDFILSSVPKMAPEDNAKIIQNKLTIKDDDLIGQVKRIYKGESKSYVLYHFHNEESSELEESLNNFITRKNKNIKISALETSDFNERDNSLTMDYNFTQKNAVASFGEEIYLDIDLYKEYSNFKFEDDRKVGYMFSHKSEIIIETELEIPQDYTIQEIPNAFKKENDIYTFDMGFEQKGDKLIYKKRIAIKKDKLPKKSLSEWNTTIKELNNFYSEQVILKKK